MMAGTDARMLVGGEEVFEIKYLVYCTYLPAFITLGLALSDQAPLHVGHNQAYKRGRGRGEREAGYSIQVTK